MKEVKHKRGLVYRMARYPVGNDHVGWHRVYVKTFEVRAKQEQAEQMRQCEWLANYYQLLALRDGVWK